MKRGTRPDDPRADEPQTPAPEPTDGRATGHRRPQPAAASRRQASRARTRWPWRSPADSAAASPAPARRSATSSAPRCGAGSAASTSGSTSDQQIRESRVRKRRLHLCRRARTARETRPPARRATPVTPKRRLADAGLTFEHAGSRPLLQGFEEAAETLLLAVPAENDAAHAPRLGTRPVFRKSAGL